MSIRPTGRETVCAVVVTHYPDASAADNLTALAPQVGRLVVVDNGSDEQSIAPVTQAVRRLNATLVRLGRNRGIAAALNAGLRLAGAQGCRWLATFDQDSRPAPGMIEEMLRALEAFPDPERIALIAPCYVARGLGLRIQERHADAAGDGWRVITTTMTSGNLVDVDAAAAVGGFDESLFIDYVDHEFCLRLRANGYRILEATRAELAHSLGRMEWRAFLFRRVAVTNHAAPRRYYMTRNRLILWRRYWRREPGWVARDLRRFLAETARIALYEEHAGAKLAMVGRGLRDGLRNAVGELDAGS